MAPVVVPRPVKSCAPKSSLAPVEVADAVETRESNVWSVVVGLAPVMVVVAKETVLDARRTPRTWRDPPMVEDAAEMNPLLRCQARLSVAEDDAV